MNNNKHYTFEKSRSGETVPVICIPVGNAQALHSMVDPVREAQRIVSQIAEDTGFLIFLGLGGGFACEAALDHTQAQIIAIDFGSDGIKELLAGRDYSKLLKSDRFSLLVDFENDNIKNFILENYKPSLSGGIKIIPLRARIEQDRRKFEEANEAIQNAIDIITGDYSVQSHFGLRWYKNILRNIKSLACSNELKIEFPQEEAAIIAAGPSLDRQIDALFELKEKNAFFISTDTALGALVHYNIKPDAVMSIDCQHLSYYHFMGADVKKMLADIPLVLDIASPPMLGCLSAVPFFFASGHPLAQYICRAWRSLTTLDTSGGNVTYSCLSLAESLGAKRITLFGADFSYVGCQTYARGTYINPYFSLRQNRLSPLESEMSAFLYRSPFLPVNDSPADSERKNYRETVQLRFYRNRLEEKASKMDAFVDCAKGFGAPVNIINKAPYAKYRTQSPAHSEESSGKYMSGTEFLIQYRNDIAALPETGNNADYLKLLNAKEKDVFTTLLPYAAAVRKRDKKIKPKGLIEEVKRLCIAEIDTIL